MNEILVFLLSVYFPLVLITVFAGSADRQASDPTELDGLRLDTTLVLRYTASVDRYGNLCSS